MSAPRSAYVHIPFCHRRCFYCDFAVVPLGDRAGGGLGPGSSSIATYLEQLHTEIALSPQGPPLATVYIGGGTPSLLTPQQISAVLQSLKRQFGFQQGAEVTLEMDPASFDLLTLQALCAVGINRVSLGGRALTTGCWNPSVVGTGATICSSAVRGWIRPAAMAACGVGALI